MTSSQIILAIVGVALTIALFVFGPTLQEKDPTQATSEESVEVDEVAALDEILGALRENFDDSTRNKLAALDSELAASRSKVERLEILNTQREVIGEQSPEWQAVLQEQVAEIEETHEAWDETGDLFATLMFKAQTEEGKSLMANKAVENYQKASTLAPDSTSYRLKEASVYLDGMNQVMNGVQILLEVVEKEPLNIDANLILGRYGLISGQIQKAISRFENVLEADSRNSEAYFYLGEAYQQAGDTEAAVRNFEMCKKLVDDPNFQQEIDKLIESITNTAGGS